MFVLGALALLLKVLIIIKDNNVQVTVLVRSVADALLVGGDDGLVAFGVDGADITIIL